MATNKSRKKPVKKAKVQRPPKSAAAPARPKAAAAPPAPVKRSTAMEKPVKKSAKSALRDSILARKSATKPISFSLDEVRAIAQTNAAKMAEAAKKSEKAPKPAAAKALLTLQQPTKPNHIKAASLTDILGFNPKRPKAAEAVVERDVPEKFKRYYKLLVDMRGQLTEGIERHSEESLKRSAKDDSGDLSAYGQNMSDGGINTFDRDFVLSLVSSEQEALSEIEAAIKRIHEGTYGICEISGKPIGKERLLAVPFARNSAEAQKELEKNRYRTRPQSGIFGEVGEEGGKMEEDSGGGDE
jgi:RNA polymerase-binding transcription factor DksA